MATAIISAPVGDLAEEGADGLVSVALEALFVGAGAGARGAVIAGADLLNLMRESQLGDALSQGPGGLFDGGKGGGEVGGLGGEEFLPMLDSVYNLIIEGHRRCSPFA